MALWQQTNLNQPQESKTDVLQAGMYANSPVVDVSSAWPQTPPQTMPWGIRPNELPSVIRFTGDVGTSSDNFQDSIINTHPGQKRKTEDEGLRPNKMLMTIEGMSTQMANMSIYKSRASLKKFEENSESEMIVTEELPKLSLSDEVKSLTSLKPMQTVPSSFHERLMKDSTAMVVWRPLKICGYPFLTPNPMYSPKKAPKIQEVVNPKQDESNNEKFDASMAMED
uniref:Uncharacterized protein n=1 Tax=Clastoptera arizonana TaxID=38151 RepID=A0A1B6E020_9HEMI